MCRGPRAQEHGLLLAAKDLLTLKIHRILRSTGVPVPRYLGRFQRSHRLLYHNFQG